MVSSTVTCSKSGVIGGSMLLFVKVTVMYISFHRACFGKINGHAAV